MPHRFVFNESVLMSVVGGKSILDLPKLHIQTAKEAHAFLEAYGYDSTVPEQIEKLWYFYRRALVFLEEKLGFLPTEIPEILRDRRQLGDLKQLLLWASSSHPKEQDLQRWSCAILRVMHVFVHIENDLFASFSEEIQKQILSPFQDCIYHEGTSGTTFLKKTGSHADEVDPLALLGFEVKPFKTSSSSVIKLLAKSDALAMNVYDKLGVRFITKSMFDTFRVVRFLVEENLISYPHIMPDQSSNSLYPVELFLQVCQQIHNTSQSLSEAEIDRRFREYLLEKKDQISFLRKENFFSGEDYRFIKFICRRLIKVPAPNGKDSFAFFFPFEVQILDKSSFEKVQSGPSEHQAYKERQKQAARKRVLHEATK